MSRCIAVFSGSSEHAPAAYHEAARELGRRLGKAGWSMVFGGGMTGLMGATARGVHDANGRVIGVIPERLNRSGVRYEVADELHVTSTLRQRKAEMDRRANGFVVLPGGFGTLEEAVETITLKQLGYHRRPVAFLNTDGYYNQLFEFIEHMVDATFVKEENLGLYSVFDSPREVVAFLDAAIDEPSMETAP